MIIVVFVLNPRRMTPTVRIRVKSHVRSRALCALRDIFETSDRDIKKGRATSCPAGGHWRGINHPRKDCISMLGTG